MRRRKSRASDQTTRPRAITLRPSRESSKTTAWSANSTKEPPSTREAIPSTHHIKDAPKYISANTPRCHLTPTAGLAKRSTATATAAKAVRTRVMVTAP
ncbi:MAG: DUF3787 domain-containing protein [Propionibacteriaceae bacterium]|nr:DUF3787 domain-containing protein [Propionibacteriaceae bacterium]